MAHRGGPSYTDVMLKNRRRRNADWAAFRWYAVLPAVALVLFVGVMVAFFWYLHRSEFEQQRQTMFRDVEWAQQTLRLRLRAHQDSVVGTAIEWADATQGDGDRLRPAARTFLQNNPDASYVGLIDNAQRIAWLLPNAGLNPPAGRLPGSPLAAPISARAHDEARTTRQPVYTPPFAAADGGMHFEMHVPVIRERAFIGTIVVGYSAARMMAVAVPAEVLNRYRVALIDQAGSLLASGPQQAMHESDIHYELALDPPGHGVRLRAWAPELRSTPLDQTLQAAVIGLSAAIVASLLLLWRYARSRAEAEAERDRLFDLSVDVLCVLRPDGRFVRVNPAFCEMFERDGPARDLLGIVHREDLATVQGALNRLALPAPDSRARSELFEVRCIVASGQRWRWLEWSVRSAADRRGKRRQPLMLYAVAHDVTDRKAAESALAAETAFRRAMEDSLLTGMRVFDMQGRIVYVNPAFCRMLGFHAHELIGTTAPFPYWPADEHSNHYATLEAALRGEAPPSGVQVRVRRKDGTLLDARMYVSPLVDATGKQTGWLTSMTDITEPTRIRHELEAAHERFATVLDELDVAVSVAAPSESPGDTLELLFANRLHRSLFEGAADGHQALTASNESSSGSDSMMSSEVFNAATQRWFEVHTRAIRWVDGRPVQLLVAADVTARRRAQDEQRLQEERLQRTSRLVTMGEMASSLAHELNQPLTAIANYTMGIAARVRAKNARGETMEANELIEMLTKTARQAERAGQVLRRIRDFVKRSEPARAACDVATIVADAVGLAEIDARRYRVRIETQVPSQMPVLYADPILIEQVLLNLVKNGIEAMRDAPRRTLRVAVRAQPDAVQFEVTDAGPGLADGAREKLFEPFFTTKPEGMGMGLNICRSIVESHHGRLWVEDGAAEGCTFGFTLPLVEVDSQRAAA